MEAPHADPAAPPGLLAAAASFCRNLLGLVLNRVELASLEFAQMRSNFLRLLLAAALGVLALWFALAFWSALIVFACWERMGSAILGWIAAAFTLAGLGMFWYIRHMLQRGDLSMPATMSELRQDRDALQKDAP